MNWGPADISLLCRHGKEPGYCERCDAAIFDREDVEGARAEGAAVAFGLMGMAEAIRVWWFGNPNKYGLHACQHGLFAPPCPECWPVDDDDPGSCGYCGQPMELVRPGKSQPTCECQNEEDALLRASRETSVSIDLGDDSATPGGFSWCGCPGECEVCEPKSSLP